MPVPRFETGDAVRIVQSPYRGFVGTVIGDDAAVGRLKFVAPVFGRETAVDVRRMDVEEVR
jgi:transcription antitermination factor NusG